MKVIIDAYNVLHQVIKDEHVSEQERKHFINQLAVYAKNKKHTVVVVFDGGPFLFPTTSEQKGITVKYSGPKDTADMIILRYIKEHAGQAMVLVSSDRELCKAAKFYDAETIKAEDFCDVIMQREQKVEQKTSMQAVKTGDAESLVDMLMMQTKVQKKIEDIEDPTQERRSPSEKLSKKERKRMHKIKKL